MKIKNAKGYKGLAVQRDNGLKAELLNAIFSLFKIFLFLQLS